MVHSIQEVIEYRKSKTKIKLRDEQWELVKKINVRRFLFHLPTGYGKTMIGLFLSEIFKKTLIVVPQVLIYNQWRRVIMDYKLSGINLQKIDTLSNSIKTGKEIKTEYTLIIIDEFHMKEKKIERILNFFNNSIFLCGLTATPKSKELTILNYDKIFDDIFSVQIKKHFYVVPIYTQISGVAKYIRVPIIRNGVKMMGNGLDYNDLLKQITEDKNRIIAIFNFIVGLPKNRFPVLLLFKRVKTIEFLWALFKHKTDYSICLSFANFNEPIDTTADIVLGSYQKMGVGVDTKHFQSLCFFDNVKDIKQPEGRLRNEGFCLYDFIDDHPVFKKHFTERTIWYKDRGATILESRTLEKVKS